MSLYPPRVSLYDPKWIRVASGDDEGKLRITGWFLSAVKGEGFSTRDGREISSGWLRYGSCPICQAMVVAESKSGHDRTWDHERWHSRNDFPVPGELLTDEDRKAGYAS